MLTNHERAPIGQLGDANVNRMRIALVPDAKPFKSSPFYARPKNLEL